MGSKIFQLVLVLVVLVALFGLALIPGGAVGAVAQVAGARLDSVGVWNPAHGLLADPAVGGGSNGG